MACTSRVLPALLALLLLAPATVSAHVTDLPGRELLRSARSLPAPPAGMAPAWCPGDAGRAHDDTGNAVTTLPDVKVIYAYASDQPNRFARFADEIQRAMGSINTIVSTAPGSARKVRFDMGTPCGPQYVDIQTVQLPGTLASYLAIGSEVFLGLELGGDLRDAGAIGVRKLRRNIVYLDRITTGAAGYGPLPGDSSPGQDNSLNTGEQTVWIYGNQSGDTGPFQNVPVGEYWTVHAPLHELWHSLGAVGPRARHASTPQSGHCSDEEDVVCGQSAGLTFRCPGQDNLMLDCGKDDYFNAQGPITDAAGAAIWNTYDSQFLCDVDRCNTLPQEPPREDDRPVVPPVERPVVATMPPVVAGPPPPRAGAVVASRLGLAKRAFRARGGTTVTWTLSRPAVTVFTVERRRGRRWVPVRGSVSRPGRAGLNRWRFAGRIGGRRLSRGRYRLVATPAGGAPVRTSFTLVG